jgi:hypothetical protein
MTTAKDKFGFVQMHLNMKMYGQAYDDGAEMQRTRKKTKKDVQTDVNRRTIGHKGREKRDVHAEERRKLK